MLSKQQRSRFIKAVNKLLLLEVSKNSLLQLDSIEYDNDKNLMKAYIKSEDTDDRIDWYLLYKNNRIYIIKSGLSPFHVATVKSDGSIDISDSGVQYMKSLANSDVNNTMFNVISQIVYMAMTVDRMSRIGENDLRASYNATYPSIFDYSDGNLENIAISIGGDVIPLTQAKQVEELRAPLTSLDTLDVDILCRHDNSYIPLFKIWLRDNTLSFSRYTLPQVKDNEPKLSNVVNKVHVSKYENVLPEIKDIISNYKKQDDIEKANSFGNVRSIVLARKSVLENKNIDTIRKPGSTDKFTNKSYAWAIDDLPNIYLSRGLDINVMLDRSNIDSYSVCIKYFATGFGNIINMHINPDPKLITDPNNLDASNNIFRVEAASDIMVEYNNGQGGMASIQYPMSSAFDLVNMLILVYNGIFDVVKLTQYNTNDVYGSSKTMFDQYSATANFSMNIDKASSPNAMVYIHSTTNPNILRVDVTVQDDGKALIYKFPIKSEWRSFKFSKGEPTLFDQCVAYSRDKQHKLQDDSGRLMLGAQLSANIRSTFTQNVMSDSKGNFININDNQQSKVNNASRLQFASKLGSMLLDVRDAFLNTFWPFIGTKQHPGKGSANYDIDEIYSNTSRKETVEVNGRKVDKWIPVLTSFSVAGGTGGSFDAMYNTKGEPEVYCSFDQKYKKVSIVRNNGKLELSDDFIKWYLFTCRDCNSIAWAIDRLVNDGRADDAGISQKIIDLYEINQDEAYDDDIAAEDQVHMGLAIDDYKNYLDDVAEHNRDTDDMYGIF